MTLTSGFGELVRSRLQETLGQSWQKKLGYEVAPYDERRLLRAFYDNADSFLPELRGQRRPDYAINVARSIKATADELAHRRLELDYDRARRLVDWIEELLSALGLEEDARQAVELKRNLERAALDQGERDGLPHAAARDYDQLVAVGRQLGYLRAELRHCARHIESDPVLSAGYIEEGLELAHRLRVEARKSVELIGREAVEATHEETDAAIAYLRAAETALRLGVGLPRGSDRWRVFVEHWEAARTDALIRPIPEL
jgi:hypothetical protein